MLLDPIPNDCTLAIVDVETYAEARADGAAYHGWHVDDRAIGKREGDVDRLTYRQGPGGFDLHTAHGKVATFGRYAIGTIVATDGYGDFKRYAGRTPGLAAELELSFCRNPFLRGRRSAENCEQQNTSHDSGRN